MSYFENLISYKRIGHEAFNEHSADKLIVEYIFVKQK